MNAYFLKAVILSSCNSMQSVRAIHSPLIKVGRFQKVSISVHYCRDAVQQVSTSDCLRMQVVGTEKPEN